MVAELAWVRALPRASGPRLLVDLFSLGHELAAAREELLLHCSHHLVSAASWDDERATQYHINDRTALGFDLTVGAR